MSPWVTPPQDSGPPVSRWETGTAGEDSTWPVSTAADPAPPPTPSWGHLGPVAEPTTQAKPVTTSRRGGNRRLGWVAGIVGAALTAGVAGFFIGSAGKGETPTTEQTTTSAAQAPFESLQIAQNKAKLDRELAGLAGPWLTSPELDNCVSDVDKGAPALGGDEGRHVTCRYGAAWVHFVVFKSPEQKEAARVYRQQLNFNSDEITPGVRDPSRTNGGVSKAAGKLIEYAFRQQEGRAMCGVFWEREEDPQAALMVEALCEESLGGAWEPLRDLWERHS